MVTGFRNGAKGSTEGAGHGTCFDLAALVGSEDENGVTDTGILSLLVSTVSEWILLA
jgi:hypothetical protein